MMRFPDLQSEQMKIDLSDTEFETYLAMLNAHATIYLHSCATGQNGKTGKNLANFIADLSGGRRVVAPKENFDAKQMVIRSVFPFELRLKDISGKKNITYETRAPKN